jgi:transcriptional regulator with XRE-family HTH domain
MSDIVALLLDDAMPPERLGSLLRDARKRRGWKRTRAASAAGTTAKKLKAYEQGAKAVPADVCARLAAAYGDDLTAHIPQRVPARSDDEWLVMGELRQPLADATSADVLATYVEIVQRLRRMKPDEPLALRASDVTALASALNRDRNEIEAHIAEILGCTLGEARALHEALLRRKVILPVAGLAAGVAAFVGVASAAPQVQAPATPVVDRAPAAAVQAAPVPSPPTNAARPVITTRTTPPEPARPTASPAPSAAPPPSTAAHAVTHATVPPDDRPPDTATVVAPQPDPEDGVVSVLPGEEPIVVIGQATSETEQP